MKYFAFAFQVGFAHFSKAYWLAYLDNG